METRKPRYGKHSITTLLLHRTVTTLSGSDEDQTHALEWRDTADDIVCSNGNLPMLAERVRLVQGGTENPHICQEMVEQGVNKNGNSMW